MRYCIDARDKVLCGFRKIQSRSEAYNLVSEELAFIRSELKRLDEAFMEAAHSRYYEKASEFRVEKHKNKLRLHELKYNCLVYMEECELKWYRWKQLQEARLFVERELN